MEIRPYRSGDAGACCDVVNAAVAVMSGLNEAARAFVAAKNSAARLDAELGPLHTVVCVAGGVVAGLGALDGDVIKRLYVAPDVHGSGVGGSILTALEEEAHRRGLPAVRVEASPSSVAFYERRGYERLADRRLTIGGAVFDYVEMRLGLET